MGIIYGTLLAGRRSGSEVCREGHSRTDHGGGYDDPGLSMIVKYAAERQIFAIPFSETKAVC
jgi:hypothetical protein